MNRFIIVAILFVGMLVAVGCSDQNAGPTGSERTVSASDHEPVHYMEVLIDAIFPGPRGLQRSARSQLRSLVKSCEKGNELDCQAKAIDLVAFGNDHFDAGNLNAAPTCEGGCPASVPETTEGALNRLNLSLLQFAGFDVTEVDPEADTEDVVIETCAPDQPCTVVPESQEYGAFLPAGACSSSCTIVGQKIDEADFEPGTGPLPTPNGQYPVFMDWSKSEAGGDEHTFNLPIEVATCVVDVGPYAPPDPGALRLAHPHPTVPDSIEFYPLDPAANVELDCSASGPLTGLGLAGGRRLTLASPGKLGGAISAFSPIAATDTLPPPAGTASTTIVFASGTSGNFEIYSLVIGESDTTEQRLTDNARLDLQPALSPDGTQIAFLSYANDGTGNFEIVVMDRDGGNATNITNTPTVAELSPAWSPDGSKIAFTQRSGGNDDIYVMNADGSNRVQLTTHPAADDQPTWSPDGTRIAFFSYRPVVGDPRAQPEHIWVMDADGSNQVNLTTHVSFNGEPSWSPDGDRIAFISTRGGNRDIYTMAATDGSGVVQLTTTADSEFFPAWSPDGSEIAFNIGAIYSIPAGGGTRKNLTIHGSDPHWGISPPGP